MENKKKIVVAVVIGICILVGLLISQKATPTKISGAYRVEHPVNMLPDEMVFENGYCEVDGISTYTYQYKGGKLYLFWGRAVWESYKCTVNRNKIVIDNNGQYVTYYRQR